MVGRITAIGALAALIHRDRTGTGARVHVSQAEAVVNQLDTRYVTDAARADDDAELRRRHQRARGFPVRRRRRVVCDLDPLR